jgi:hypothetical protein
MQGGDAMNCINCECGHCKPYDSAKLAKLALESTLKQVDEYVSHSVFMTPHYEDRSMSGNPPKLVQTGVSITITMKGKLEEVMG